MARGRRRRSRSARAPTSAPLALFAASVATDASGRAQVPVKLPDSLTRYRVMAVAVAGAAPLRLGRVDAHRAPAADGAAVAAALPELRRPLRAAGRGAEPDRARADRGRRGARQERRAHRRRRAPARRAPRTTASRCASRAAVRAGHARASRSARRRARPPTRRRSSCRSGRRPRPRPSRPTARSTTARWSQPVRAPADARPEFGGLEVTTSSTALQALTDAVLYLVAYPFECSEQLSSRVLAIAALRDVLAAFQAEGLPKPDALEAAMKRDIERLRALQNDDGGFGFWRRGDALVAVRVASTWPTRSRARRRRASRSRPGARALAGLPEADRRAHPHGLSARRAPHARGLRALHARAAGRPRRRPGRARSCARRAPEGLSFEALGWLLPVLSKDKPSATELLAVRRRIANRRHRDGRQPPTSRSPTATLPTSSSTPTGAPTRSCSRR